jgi:hypothetical protein
MQKYYEWKKLNLEYGFWKKTNFLIRIRFGVGAGMLLT